MQIYQEKRRLTANEQDGTIAAHMVCMERAHFLNHLTHAIAEFVNNNLAQTSLFSFKRSNRLEVGSDISGKDKLGLLLAGVHTEAKPLESPLEEQEMEINNRVVSVTVRAPWLYSVRYLIIGPQLHSKEGQQSAGELHSLFFDNPQLPDSVLKTHKIDFLEPVALLPTVLEDNDFSMIRSLGGRRLGIITAIQANFLFSTGTHVTVEQRVLRRDIGLDVNQ